jgi:hypothetical protein
MITIEIWVAFNAWIGIALSFLVISAFISVFRWFRSILV